MEIVLAAVVAAVVAGGVVLLVQRSSPRHAAVGGSSAPAPSRLVQERAEPITEPPPEPETRDEIKLELRERRAELARAEERILGKEQSLDVRLAEIDRRERSFEDRQRNL